MKKEYMFCNYCHVSGHTEDKCWQKNWKPDWAKQMHTSNINTTMASPLSASATSTTPSARGISVILSHDDFEALLKLAQPDPTFPSASLVQVSNDHHGQQPSPSSRRVDSGASDHMTGNPKMFCQFLVFPKPRKVLLADQFHAVIAFGQVRVSLTDSHFLDEALYVPSLPISLLSVKKLTSSLPC